MYIYVLIRLKYDVAVCFRTQEVRTTWGIAFGSSLAPNNSLRNHTTKLRFYVLHSNSSPLEIFSKLRRQYKIAYLLESMEGPEKLAQFSLVGFDPSVTVEVRKGKATVRNNRTGTQNVEIIDNPLNILQRFLKDREVDNEEFRFIGGAVGYFSYEAVQYWEKSLAKVESGKMFPDAEFCIFDDGIIFDHTKNRVLYYCQESSRLREMEKALEHTEIEQTLTYTQPKLNVTKKQFVDAVRKAKVYISKGDIFQVVLSKQYSFTINGDLIGFYRSLRQINPSPYMYFLKIDDRQIIGSSPEMLVRVDKGIVETFPIAGTRPSTGNSLENARLAEELLADPKECAEHVMLVDLARNDLGKISNFGSVHVTEFMKVHSYSHVQHIVSRVEGKLKTECKSYDALGAVFPAGTVSGAPKVRAMEIINELEPTPRGPYAGAIGYFSCNGNADFAITIRTLFANKNKAYIQAGAGIVADSVPGHEWIETDRKAEALMKALAISEGEKR